jgi:DNA-binding NarL/FixJ family response regulator
MAQKNQSIKTTQNKTRILIVDDHPIVRQGLAELINQEEDLLVCAQAENTVGALDIIKKEKPDMAIVDISLKDTSGMELIKDLKVQYPKLPVLALSMHDESLYAERSLRAGAKGYIMKSEATENIACAVRKVLAGQIYVSESMAEKLVHKLVDGGTGVSTSDVDKLSDRELEVFLLIGKGFGTRQIAKKLCLSSKTIDTYKAHIKDKLKISGSDELLQYAIQWTKKQDTI